MTSIIITQVNIIQLGAVNPAFKTILIPSISSQARRHSIHK